MADEGLFGVPMSFTPQDTLLGSLSAGIGRGTPSLISPYASTGSAVGIGLGSILLQSLLGYQARQQAAERTLELNRLSSSLLGMKTAQERADYIGTLGDVDPLVLGRLGSLSGALAGQEIQQQRALDLERSRKMLGLDIELSPEAQQLADLNLGRKIAEIEARNAGFTSGLGIRAGDPEKRRIMTENFGPLNLQAQTALNNLTPEEWTAIDQKQLDPNTALQLANTRQRSIQVAPGATGLSPTQIEKATEQDQIINDTKAHVERLKEIPPKALFAALKLPFGTASGKVIAQLEGGQLPEGFTAINENLASDIRNKLFGATLTNNEQKSFDIVTGKELTTDKADIVRAWKFIMERAESNLRSRRKYTGMTKEEFATSGAQPTPTATPTAETDKAAVLQQMKDELKAVMERINQKKLARGQ
jgi:hypothetical protein